MRRRNRTKAQRIDTIIGMVMDRNIFQTKDDLILEALEMWFEKRLEYESTLHRTSIPDWVVELQIKAAERLFKP